MLLSLSSQLTKTVSALIFSLFVVSLTACSPEVGSDKWCQQMSDKNKGDWTANEAADYAKHCVFK